MPKFYNLSKVVHPHEYHKVKNPANTKTDNPGCDGSIPTETKTNIFHGISDDQIILDHLIGQSVRRILGTHSNFNFLADSVTQFSDLNDSLRTDSPLGGSHRGNAPQGSPLRDLSEYEIVRPRDLPFLTGLSRTTCWRLSRDPNSGFPPKIRLSAGAVGFSKNSIREWIKSREGV